MTDKSGGQAYPTCHTNTTPGMNLRECFAVAIVTGGILQPQAGDMPSGWVLNEAQKLTDECMARRKQDAAEEQLE